MLRAPGSRDYYWKSGAAIRAAVGTAISAAVRTTISAAVRAAVRTAVRTTISAAIGAAISATAQRLSAVDAVGHHHVVVAESHDTPS